MVRSNPHLRGENLDALETAAVDGLAAMVSERPGLAQAITAALAGEAPATVHQLPNPDVGPNDK